MPKMKGVPWVMAISPRTAAPTCIGRWIDIMQHRWFRSTDGSAAPMVPQYRWIRSTDEETASSELCSRVCLC